MQPVDVSEMKKATKLIKNKSKDLLLATVAATD